MSWPLSLRGLLNPCDARVCVNRGLHALARFLPGKIWGMINTRVDLARPASPSTAALPEQKQEPFVVVADELLDVLAFVANKVAAHASKPELGDAARRAASVAAALRQAVPVLYRLATSA